MNEHQIESLRTQPIVILGLPIDNLDMGSAVTAILALVGAYEEDHRPRQVTTINVDFLVNTHAWGFRGSRHPELLEVLRRSDLVTADGMPIVWISWLLGTPLKERVAGADLVPALCRAAAASERSVFLLGGQGDVGKRAAAILQRQSPGLKIAGVYSPFVHTEGVQMDDESDTDTVERINASGADILFIGFGNPKQELWFHRNRHRLRVGVSIGIGGTYEFLTGSVKRAPVWMQKSGLEWIFRITQDPKRLWKRYFVGIFKLAFMVLPGLLYYKFARWRVRNISVQAQGMVNVGNTIWAPGMDVITLPSTLDHGWNDIQQRLIEQLPQKTELVLALDFSSVKLVDSRGLGMLVQLWREAGNHRCHIYGFNLRNESVIRLFKLTRIYDILEPNLADSLEQLQERILKQNNLPEFYYTTDKTECDVVIISLFGRLDAANTRNLDHSELIEHINGKHCILDLQHLTFVDSTGLILFVRLQKHFAGLDRELMMCHLNDTVRQLFKITRLEQFFQIEKSVEHAKENLSNS